MVRQRRFLACMALAAVVLAGTQAALGSADVLLAAAPLLLLAGLLLCGRFVGEERILARMARLVAPLRRVRARWRPAVERPLAAMAVRSALPVRGPPAA